MRVARMLVAERVVVTSIVLGAIAVFALGFTEAGTPAHSAWLAVDVGIICYFAIEQALKLRCAGWERYWATRWNRFDLVVTVLSLPVLVAPLGGASLFAGVPILRVARLFRLFRLLRFIPDHEHLGAGIRRAIRASVGVFLGIALVNFIFAMGGHLLFGPHAPELFGNPVQACYSMFRIFTIDGWHDIPQAIARQTSEGWAMFARIYFGAAVLVGGILGLALGNAVFVDQMMADNHEVVERDVNLVALEVTLLRAELAEVRALLERRGHRKERRNSDSRVA